MSEVKPAQKDAYTMILEAIDSGIYKPGDRLVESELAMAKRLVIGEMELTNVPIGFADSPAIEALGLADRPALILGMGNLRMFERVAIDFSSRRVLFDLPGTTNRRQLFAPDFMATRTKS